MTNSALKTVSKKVNVHGYSLICASRVSSFFSFDFLRSTNLDKDNETKLCMDGKTERGNKNAMPKMRFSATLYEITEDMRFHVQA